MCIFMNITAGLKGYQILLVLLVKNGTHEQQTGGV